MRVLLVNYDNGSRWPVLPQNLMVLKQAVSQCVDYVDIQDFNLTKKPYSWLERVYYDVIGLGFISGYWPHAEAQKIAYHVNKNPLRDQIKWVVGGHGPSAAPHYYQKLLRADSVFTGAADKSFRKWITAGRPDGIHPSNGYCMRPHPYNIEGMDVYKRISFPSTKTDEFAIQILSGRGCPYKCAFCYRMDREFAQYDVSTLVDSIDGLAEAHGIRHFQLSDELFMASKTYVETFCEAITDLQLEKGYELGFDCNGRLNLAQEGLLGKMKDAGFRYINYGCESMDDRVLVAIQKKQTGAQIREGIEATLRAGLSPGLNFMWGNPNDSPATLEKAVEFINQHSDGVELRTIRPVTPYPGTALFEKLLEEGRLPVLEPVDWFYKKHLNSDLFSFHFMDMSNEQADDLLLHANLEILHVHAKNKLTRMGKEAERFYHHKSLPDSFRGWRDV